ncbi:interleukin-15 isoform X2 [Eptesicus fuscus]|uniref:interleukin-15 isoform X2 n=1 Tax=Eptesicus fuscus TaxID=29078 RepID=UPI002403C6AD|nr:interleukin-15 isoform X2 [Eptesicus fuscus]
MRISKPYWRSTSIQCYLCLLLNSHFLTEAGIPVFIWGCISESLPKTEANWQDVISDLEKFENLIQSIHIDATLYTESDVQNITESGCKECEELEEKNVKEFLRSFVNIVQMFINTS